MIINTDSFINHCNFTNSSTSSFINSSINCQLQQFHQHEQHSISQFHLVSLLSISLLKLSSILLLNHLNHFHHLNCLLHLICLHCLNFLHHSNCMHHLNCLHCLHCLHVNSSSYLIHKICLYYLCNSLLSLLICHNTSFINGTTL